jgi:excisionase family DNA binding protein
MEQEFSEIWTVEDLMDRLMIGRNTVYDLLKSQQIKAFKIGHNWKIPKESVEEYILHKCRKGTE